jgi:hypothetical protein
LDHQRAEDDGEGGQHIRSRYGNAGGSAIAAARETMPRMPAHEIINPLLMVGRSADENRTVGVAT